MWEGGCSRRRQPRWPARGGTPCWAPCSTPTGTRAPRPRATAWRSTSSTATRSASRCCWTCSARAGSTCRRRYRRGRSAARRSTTGSSTASAPHGGGGFEGDRLRLAASVAGRTPGDGTAVRAAPDGGCCVAHGGVVRVYNWMLEERRPVYLDHAPVNDAAYLDEATLLVAARERPGRRDGGVAAFSALTGDLHHRFRIAHDRQVRSFTPGALAFDHRCKIFASCKGRFNEYGIGVWDYNTGDQADFFYEPPGCALGDADKLQWLDGTSTLMVTTMFPRTDNSFISLLDFRDKNVAWSWSDVGTPASLEDKHVLHAIATEDGRSVCVINQYDDLGFLDLRSNAVGVRWRSRSKLTTKKKTHNEETCYPKLAAHGGQLFASTNDTISVFSGPDHILTSTLRGSDAGAICDFSIGGDRLFALHNEENVFDVWDTPPPPVI
ncbi:hypothetical protein ABZP36_024144 [Zizania latifolia]